MLDQIFLINISFHVLLLLVSFVSSPIKLYFIILWLQSQFELMIGENGIKRRRFSISGTCREGSRRFLRSEVKWEDQRGPKLGCLTTMTCLTNKPPSSFGTVEEFASWMPENFFHFNRPLFNILHRDWNFCNLQFVSYHKFRVVFPLQMEIEKLIKQMLFSLRRIT